MFANESVFQIRANQIGFADGRIAHHHTLDGLFRLINRIFFVAFSATLFAGLLAFVADTVFRVNPFVLTYTNYISLNDFVH